jgi:CBS domain-containing protein
MKFTDDLKAFCSDKSHRLMDFRPYMIPHPYTVSTTDPLEKCVSIFRYMHLRHLAVLHPGTGQLRGMITRKDLFKFMDL